MSNKETIQLVECPRDAIQGIQHFIPTAKKINYINQLIDSNLFYCIDLGSFVSFKTVPQMQDTVQVLEGIERKTGQNYWQLLLMRRALKLPSRCIILISWVIPFQFPKHFSSETQILPWSS